MSVTWRGIVVLVAAVVGSQAAGLSAGTAAAPLRPARTGAVQPVTVKLGAAPVALAGAAGSLWLLAEDNGGAVVLRLDRSTGARLAVFRVGPAGSDIGAVTVAQGRVWAVAGTHLLRIDPSHPDQVARASLPGVASGVAVGLGGVWVTTIGQQRNLLVRLNPMSLTISARLLLPSEASSIVGPTPLIVALASVWVADGGMLLRIDPGHGHVSAEFPSAPPPTDLTLAQGRIWTLGGSTVRALTRQGRTVAEINLPVASSRLTRTSGRLWAIDNCGCRRGTLLELDLKTKRILARLPTGETPIAITADRTAVWVANFNDSTLQRFRAR